MPSLHRYFVIRNYTYTKCIICGDRIMHNQYYKKRTFNRIAHIECYKRMYRGKKRSRMNDTVKYKDKTINGVMTWKEV